MSLPDPADLKKKLRAEGFEIYRTLPGQIQLAERVRNNLIMDSGVAVEFEKNTARLTVAVTVKAQASHFPGADEDHLSSQVEKLAAEFTAAGYERQSSTTQPVPDPNDPERALDFSYEIRLSRNVEDLSRLFSELKDVLGRPRHSSDD